MKREEIRQMAIEAGFDEYEDWCLSGNSDDDQLVAVQEFPVGEAVLKLVAMVEAKEREACAKVAASYRMIGAGTIAAAIRERGEAS